MSRQSIYVILPTPQTLDYIFIILSYMFGKIHRISFKTVSYKPVEKTDGQLLN